MYFDIHTHVTIKPYHNRNLLLDPAEFPDPNHWSARNLLLEDEEGYHKLVDKLDKSLLIRSQGHLESMYKGGFRSITVSLYPIESGFAQVTKLIETIANIFSRDTTRAIASIIGISPDAVSNIESKGYHYFEDLLKEASNLAEGPSVHQLSNGISIRFALAENYDELNTLLQEPRTLVLQLSIEGAHSFLHGIAQNEIKRLLRKAYRKPQDPRLQQITRETIQNIERFKSLYPSLFFVTFAHHFFNLMCGHAYTFNRLLFNQNPAKYARLGFTQLGLEVLESLLSRETTDGFPQRRVLIDTKHMSVTSRFEFHRIILDKKVQGDRIPIIQSHTAVNGRRSLIDAANRMTSRPWIKGPFEEEIVRYQSKFVPLDLNLFDDEIKHIINSDGLIGIMLDEKRICGKRLPDDIKDIPKEIITVSLPGENSYALDKCSRFKRAKKELGKILFKIKYCEQCLEDPNITAMERDSHENAILSLREKVDHIRAKLRPISASLILNQLLYIAEVYGSVKAWDHICIGSDFDGVINPLDTYPEAKYLSTLNEDLLSHWNMMFHLHNDRYTRFKYGLSIDIILQKFLSMNARRFYSRYFTSEYLAAGITPLFDGDMA